MRNSRSGILVLWLLASPLWAQVPAPQKFPSPVFLSPTDKIPMDALRTPKIPRKGLDGSVLQVKGNIGAPSEEFLEKISQPDLISALQGAKSLERQTNRVYWHRGMDFDYCHFRDGEGNHWYGWIDGGVFVWVLRQGKRFWWHDDFAGNWFYYSNHHWWRSAGQMEGQVQVLFQGEYYLCQRDGTVLKDMGQDGKGNLTSGNGPFRGDFHHGGHGRGGGHSGKGTQSSTRPASGSPAASSSP